MMTKPLNLSRARIQKTTLRNANLTRANLSRADCSFVDFRGANFLDAKLDHAILRGADLRETRNLTLDQLKSAIVDSSTKLPTYLASHKEALVNSSLLRA